MATGITELLVIPLVGAALQVLIGKLASREFWHLFKKRGLEHKQLTELNFLLLTITAVLTDAEEKEITNPSVKVWVEELKDTVYEAEDVLDEIFSSRNHKQADLKKKVEDIMSRLKSVAEQKDVLGLNGSGGKTSSRLPSTCLVSEPQVLGRENDERVILEFLLSTGGSDNQIPGVIANGHVLVAYKGEVLTANENGGTPSMNENGRALNQNMNGNEVQVRDENEEIPVLAIVGMPGVGKTTLAQLVFNIKRVKENFDVKVWIHVSQELNVVEVTKNIYNYIISHHCPTLELNKLQVSLEAAQTADLNTLQVRIQEALRGKKLLLVVDDIWSENVDDWDVLKRPFKDVASGSRIILTSRSSSVASTLRASRIHHLTCLSNDDCWSLFIKYAFKRGVDSEVHPEIKERIVKKCSGLPLAAKALGALLYSKEEIDEWIGVLNSEIWELPSDKCSILPVLRLSYCCCSTEVKY